MSNRCEDCSKFVSLEMGEPEIVDAVFEEDENTISGYVRLVKQCAECGSEMQEAHPEFEFDVDMQDHKTSNKCGRGIEDDSIEPTERGEGRGQYMKTFYGADITFQLSCGCGWKGTASGSVEEQASHFDEC